jgi:hypothetical protein
VKTARPARLTDTFAQSHSLNSGFLCLFPVREYRSANQWSWCRHFDGLSAVKRAGGSWRAWWGS